MLDNNSIFGGISEGNVSRLNFELAHKILGTVVIGGMNRVDPNFKRPDLWVFAQRSGNRTALCFFIPEFKLL